MTAFDDFLGLDCADLSRFRTVIFHGRSGSGKSTAIAHLLATKFRERANVTVVDEIGTIADLLRLRASLRRGEVVLVASHVPPALVRLFARGPVAVFHTDREPSKIGRYFERAGISASRNAVEAYVRRFGATYTDADLIMERWPSRSFDESFARFLKLDRIEATITGGRRRG